MARVNDTSGRIASEAQMDIDSHDPEIIQPTAEGDDAMLPRVVSVVPAIFVPVEIDYTDPFTPPKNGAERARMALESIEFHRTGGLKGFEHLTELERRRILGQARRWKSEHGTEDKKKPGVPPQEVDAMIRCMSAPRTAGVDYNTPTEGVPPPNFLAHLDRPDEADSLRQLHLLVEQSLCQQKGYEAHMDKNKACWTEVLEREQKAMELQANNTSEDVEMG